jgi:hypothetical protein
VLLDVLADKIVDVALFLRQRAQVGHDFNSRFVCG